jgi:hypothetical protein
VAKARDAGIALDADTSISLHGGLSRDIRGVRRAAGRRGDGSTPTARWRA